MKSLTVFILCIFVSEVYLHPPRHNGQGSHEDHVNCYHRSPPPPQEYENFPGPLNQHPQPQSNSQKDSKLKSGTLPVNSKSEPAIIQQEWSTSLSKVNGSSPSNSVSSNILPFFDVHHLVDVDENNCGKGEIRDPSGDCQKIEQNS